MMKPFVRAVLCTLLAVIAVSPFTATAAVYVPYSTDGMTASQSHPFSNDPGGNGAGSAIDGLTGGNLAGWTNGELVGADGNKTSDNANLDYGTNWWLCDLGEVKEIDQIKIFFEGAYATQFKIEYYTSDPSLDAAAEAVVEKVVESNTTTDFSLANDETVSARYVRLNFKAATNAAWGIKFYEVQFLRDVESQLASCKLVSKESGNEILVEGNTYNMVCNLYDAAGNFITAYDTFTLSSESPNITIADKTITAVSVGDATVAVAIGDKTLDANLHVVGAFDPQSGVNLLHNGGDLGTQFWFHPNKDAAGESLLWGEESRLVDKSLTTGNYGWKDNALGSEKNLKKGDAYFTLGMRRLCNVNAVRINHAQAKVTSFTLEFFERNPELSENVGISPVYTLDCVNSTEDWQEIVLPQVLENVRFIRFNLTGMDNPAWGARLDEIEVYGEDADGKTYTADAFKFNRKDVPLGENYVATVNLYDSQNDILLDEVNDSYVTIAVSETQEDGFTGRILTESDKEGAQKNGYIEGVARGLVAVSATVNDTDNNFNQTIEGVIEVTTKNWSQQVNIARRYRTYAEGEDRKAVDNGMTDGNPKSKAYAGNCVGGVNETISGIIDGDWYAWTISPEELAQENKPYVVIDLGAAYPVNEFNIHWNADGDGEGNGSYLMMKGDYEVYGYAGDFADAPDASADGWTNLYTVKHNDPARYDVDRHVFRTNTVRYIMFRFTEPMYAALPIAFNEITIGGPEFVAADGTLVRYEAGDVAEIATPRFDRSPNDEHRDLNRNFIVALKNYYEANPLYVAYQVRDCYGRSLVSEGDVAEYVIAEDGAGEFLDLPAGKKVNWRGVDWTNTSKIFHPAALGKATVKIVVKDAGGKEKYITDELSIYVISDRYNVNRYAYAFDNAKHTAEGWNDPENPDKSGDRDLTSTGTAPQNASDGNFGSWWAIGYYGDGDHMGSTYKYAANTTLDNPYELVMDYRGETPTDTPSVYAKELDMVSVLFEGAYPRDYDVYVLQMEEKDGVMTVKKDAQGNDAWEMVKSFNGLLPMGVGQEENHRIYRMTAEGLPDVDAEGRIKPWENVAAVKLVFRALGTQWGLKIKESALYGKLNKPVVASELRQARYEDAAATKEVENGRYYGFDLVASMDLSDKSIIEQQGADVVGQLTASLDKISGYDVKLYRRKLDESSNKFVADPFTATDKPVYSADADAAVDEDGNFIFHVEPDVEKGSVEDGELYNYFSNVVVEDVDPSKYYEIVVSPVFADATVEEFEILESPLADLHVPGTEIVINNLSLEKYDLPISGVRHEANAGTHHHGSVENVHYTSYDAANQFSLNGVMYPILVTDKVLENYDLTVDVDADCNGVNYALAGNIASGTKGVNMRDMNMTLTYLPVASEVKKASELIAMPEDAPQAVKDKMVNYPAIPEMMTGNVTAHVGYSRTNGMKGVSKDAVRKYENISTADVRAKLSPLGGWINHEIHIYRPVDKSTCNAFIGLAMNPGQRPLNCFAGFYASNDYHEENILSGEYRGGRPFGSDDEPWYGVADYSWKADNGTSNFGRKAVEGERLGVYLQRVANPDDSDVAIKTQTKVYLFTTNEYPVLLCRPDSEGNIESGEVYPSMIVTPIAEGEDSPADIVLSHRQPKDAQTMRADSNADNIQPLTLPLIHTIDFAKHDTGDIMTSVGSVADDAAGAALKVYPSPAVNNVTVAASDALVSVEIYSLEGALVKNVKTDDNVVVLDVADLSSGIYVVRAAGSTARLIKK